MVVMSARVATAVTVVVAGGPGRGAARPAALGWGCTQGPPRVSLRHQRVSEADTWGALATEGTIFWGQLAWGPCRGLGGTAEPQLRHGMAVRGPSQKAGGFLRTCSWKEMEGVPVSASLSGEACGRAFSIPLSPIMTGKVGQGSERGSKVGSLGNRKPETGSEWRSRTRLVHGGVA